MTAKELKQIIRAEIKRRKEQAGIGLSEYEAGHENGICELCDDLLSFIDTIQVDEPEGLDEAADKYLDTQDVAEMFCGDYEGWQIIDAFKAGAEWMANQGETIEGSLGYGPHLQRPIIMLEQVPKIWNGHCQNVIVQIRKKEESK